MYITNKSNSPIFDGYIIEWREQNNFLKIIFLIFSRAYISIEYSKPFFSKFNAITAVYNTRIPCKSRFLYSDSLYYNRDDITI